MVNPFEFLQNAFRAKEIATVLAKYGFSDLLRHLDSHPGLLQRFVPKPKEDLTTWERIRMACEDLGPTFIKFGQILSMRPDIVPQPLVAELRKLQDKVRPIEFAEMREVAVAELGKPLEAVFDRFDETPVATASLAQVYFARTRIGRREVAVKVQRPGVHQVVESDMEILAWFAGQLHRRVDALKPYDLPGVVAELGAAMHRELDFQNEGRNMRFFNAMNPFPDQVFAPEAVEGLTTARVIVMNRVDGRRLDDTGLPPEQAVAVARNGARSMVHQILSVGFFHADPHPGNLCITPDGRVCFFDWGMVGQLTRHMRYRLADFFEAAAAMDAERLVRVALLLSSSAKKIDISGMEKEVTFILREMMGGDKPPEIGRLILRLFFVFGRNGIDVAEDYSLMAKSVLSIEEAAEMLDPGFDIREIALPMVRKLHRERWLPQTLLRDAGLFANTGMHFFREFPAEVARIFRRLNADDLIVNFQHRGLEEFTDAINGASNRITLGVVIGSLLIGSSLIITTGVEPLWFGYPALGLVGYLLSAVLGVYTIIDIIRHGRHK